MTRGDLGILGVVVVMIIAAVLIAAAPLASATEATIKGPYGETVISLDRDATYHVQGSMGELLIVVEDGVVRCTESCCADQICVAGGPLGAGHPIVCAPNGVVVTLRGVERGQLDAVSR